MKSKMFYSRSPCTHFKKKNVIKTIDVPFWSTIDVPPTPFLPPQLHTYLTKYVPNLIMPTILLVLRFIRYKGRLESGI